MQKIATCIGLNTEQILSANIQYTYFLILGVAFVVPFLLFPKTQASCGKKKTEIIFAALDFYLYEFKTCISDF